MKILKIPVISGKDSLSSTYRGAKEVIKIPPVLCLSVFGKIPDISKTVTADFKKEGSVIMLIGKQDLNLGGSTYFDILSSHHPDPESSSGEGSKIPKVDLKILPKVLSTLHQAINQGKVLSAHDVSEGGVITAIFEMCLGGNLGAKVLVNGQADEFLFNETAGTFIVEAENENIAKALFKNIPFKIIGRTKLRKTIEVVTGKSKLFTVEISQLEEAWKKPMKEIFS